MNFRILASFASAMLAATFAAAGNPVHSELHVLPPVTKGNLSIFPVVGGAENDTAHLLTLDEGLRAGSVVVTEAGSLQGLVRPGTPWPRQSGAEVNRLVLINNSDHPLLLLAGEVVTGGKQDRVIGVDRIVPPKSGPIDLSVFCVEPGRWVASSEHFGTMKSQMAQPSVRTAGDGRAQSAERLGTGGSALSEAWPEPFRKPVLPCAHPPRTPRRWRIPTCEKKVASVAADYDGMLRELKKEGAKGVVVAINGRILWADVFASTESAGEVLAEAHPFVCCRFSDDRQRTRPGRSEVGAVVSRPTSGQSRGHGDGTWTLPPHRNQRRWLSGLQLDLAGLEAGIHRPPCQDGIQRK